MFGYSTYMQCMFMYGLIWALPVRKAPPPLPSGKSQSCLHSMSAHHQPDSKTSFKWRYYCMPIICGAWLYWFLISALFLTLDPPLSVLNNKQTKTKLSLTHFYIFFWICACCILMHTTIYLQTKLHKLQNSRQVDNKAKHMRHPLCFRNENSWWLFSSFSIQRLRSVEVFNSIST